nr:acetyltransferase [uncultured Allomuricauda sp.]
MVKNNALGIIGAGDLGQQIAHFAIEDGHFDTVFFFDDFTEKDVVNGHKVLGGIKDVLHLYKKGVFDKLILGIGYKHLDAREQLFNQFMPHIPFSTIVHSSCWVDVTAEIGEGCVIYPSCTVDANVKIGSNCVLNIGTTISHDSVIGKHCFISPRVAMAGFVNIGKKCILGINATIIDNVSLTDKAQLGAGTVVINNLDKKGLYVGNPARFIR